VQRSSDTIIIPDWLRGARATVDRWVSMTPDERYRVADMAHGPMLRYTEKPLRRIPTWAFDNPNDAALHTVANLIQETLIAATLADKRAAQEAA
jgi:hypothetical protein